MDVSVCELTQQPVLGVHEVVPVGDLPEFFGRAYVAVARDLERQGVAPVGPPVALYDAAVSATADVTAGFPTAAGVAGSDVVRSLLAAALPRAVHARPRRIGEIVTSTGGSDSEIGSASITGRITELGDWRGETLARLRGLIHAADPDIQEEWKWVKPSSPGVPVWSHDGGVCTGESYKQVVKLTFFRGASIEDPEQLFNARLGGNPRRAIDLREGETIDENAFTRLIQAAVAANTRVLAERAAKKK